MTFDQYEIGHGVLKSACEIMNTNVVWCQWRKKVSLDAHAATETIVSASQTVHMQLEKHDLQVLR